MGQELQIFDHFGRRSILIDNFSVTGRTILSFDVHNLLPKDAIPPPGRGAVDGVGAHEGKHHQTEDNHDENPFEVRCIRFVEGAGDGRVRSARFVPVEDVSES